MLLHGLGKFYLRMKLAWDKPGSIEERGKERRIVDK
jgi:hypothetical protein